MDLLNFFQFLQALLAIFVVLCLCTKGPVKHHCHVALVVLVISMMIIPPFGRNFLSTASMKEGATTANDTTHDADGIITPKEKEKINKQKKEAHETACKIGAMTIEEFIKQYPDNNTMRVVDLVRSLNLGDIRACKYTKHKHQHSIWPIVPGELV